MPRAILFGKQNEKITLDSNSKIKSKESSLKIEALLRRKRTEKYMNALSKLDIGDYEESARQLDECVKTIKEEFADIPSMSELVGIVAKCYIGKEYDVHTLSLTGNIITHYKKTESMPDMLGKARTLAVLHSEYKFIEVYTDIMCAVKNDGTVSIIK